MLPRCFQKTPSVYLTVQPEVTVGVAGTNMYIEVLIRVRTFIL